MMQQINREEYAKGRKRTDQPEKSFVRGYVRSWCLRLETSPAPPEDVLQKKFRLQKKLCWFLSVKHLCPLYRNRQIGKVTMTTTKQRGRHALQRRVQTEPDCPERL